MGIGLTTAWVVGVIADAALLPFWWVITLVVVVAFLAMLTAAGIYDRVTRNVDPERGDTQE